MKMLILLTLLFEAHCICKAQNIDMLQKKIATSLSYKTIPYKSSSKDSKISIHQVAFNGGTMSYSIFKSSDDRTERFTIRLLIAGLSEITMSKTREGYNVLLFTTKRNSIIKEYVNGSIVHEKWQVIPLERPDVETLARIRKLQHIFICRSN